MVIPHHDAKDDADEADEEISGQSLFCLGMAIGGNARSQLGVVDGAKHHKDETGDSYDETNDVVVCHDKELQSVMKPFL